MKPISEEDAKEIYETVHLELGKNAAELVDILASSEASLTVEQLEESMEERDIKLETKDIRQILYSLNDKGYARSKRIRDKETGWIHFLWELKPRRILK